MTNRIFKWWDDVQKWKDRFEKMFPPWFVTSKEFQKAELAKLRSVLEKKTGKLSEEEKLSKKILQGYYSKLEKEIYPKISSRIAARMGNYLQNLSNELYSKIKPSKTITKEVLKPSSPEVTKMLGDFEQSNKLKITRNNPYKSDVQSMSERPSKGKIIEFPKVALKNGSRKRRL
ncbi:hypothetical protein [Sphingobacterium sp. UBA5670]|uniref:hypothetical protein n=1 Tax=Sphingobacterium sp. UBA5670 TaxID=1947502 RepID=UPI0025EE8A3A|nr:hypothetical protein [Sphingobacterium sp. UBA5670]